MGFFQKIGKLFSRESAQIKKSTNNTQPVVLYNITGLDDGFTGEKYSHALQRKLFNPDKIDYEKVRHLSREYYNSNSLARTAIDTKTTSIINRGLILEAKPLVQALHGIIVPEDWSKNTELRFDLWASHKGADTCWHQNFYQIQSELFRHYLLHGRCFSLIRYNADSKRGRIGRINLQTVHSSQISTPTELIFNNHDTNKTGKIISGCKIDKSGTLVGIYIRTSNTDTSLSGYTYIPRWGGRTGRLNFVHMMNGQFPGDYNGLPDLTPILHDLSKVEQYKVAELEAAAVNASLALIQNSDGQQANPSMLRSSGVGTRTDDVTDADGVARSKVTRDLLAPGMHLFAAQPGQKLESFDTKRPSVNFEAFLKAMAVHCSPAIQIPYEILLKHFSNNYSASRAALLEFWRYVLQARATLAADICHPIYDAWLSDELLLGVINAEGWFSDDPTQRIRIRRAWAHSAWQGMSKGSVDIFKEVKAHEIAEDRGWITAEANARELFGKNFDTNIDRRIIEKEKQEQGKLS